MNRMISVLTASALIFGVFPSIGDAVAQTGEELVGMWTLVSVTLEQDGNKTDMYGAPPQGQAIFAPNGRFSIMFIRSDVPKFVSANREAGTPEEIKAAVNGSIAYFGTYSVAKLDSVTSQISMDLYIVQRYILPNLPHPYRRERFGRNPHGSSQDPWIAN